MAKFLEELNDTIRSFIGEQKIFFTASAPAKGRINLSPKGIDTFRCLDSKTVAYLDLTGSGNETAAHIAENGRMTIMFCSFSDKPLILRLYGTGRIIGRNHENWETLHQHFPKFVGERQIVVLSIESLQTSCGFGVPVYDLVEERVKLIDWAEKKGDAGINLYWKEKNHLSIDGLPTGILD